MVTMSFVDATEKILKEKNQETSVSEIAEEIIKRKLVDTEGRTPKNTLYSAIHQENKRRGITGEKKRFTLGGGKVGLTEWIKDGVEGEIEQRNETVKNSLLEKIQEMPPQEVEKLVEILLVKMGFDAQTTRFVKDKGVDIRGELVTAGVIRMPIAVQVKRHKAAVSSDDIQKLRGALDKNRDEHGVFVTTGTFSKAAYEEAKSTSRTAIDLINGRELVNLLAQYKIGIKKYEVMEIVDFALADGDVEVSE